MSAPRDTPRWFQVLEVAPGETPPADGFDRIYRHELAGIVLRGTVPPALAREACERLDRLEAPASVRVTPVVSRGTSPVLDVLGRSLRLSPWGEYAAAIEPVRAIHAHIFAHPDGLEAVLRARFAAMCGGAPPAPLVGQGGEPFARALVATLRPGGMLPYHFDNYCFHEETSFARVKGIVRDVTLVNALTILRPAGAGGALELAAYDWAEYVGSTGRTDACAWEDELVAGRETTIVELAAGDTLVFDAGRIVHRVTPVGAGAPRSSYVWHMGRLDGSDEIRTFV
jgi:hypothetical protein